jgi:hypothetical protein
LAAAGDGVPAQPFEPEALGRAERPDGPGALQQRPPVFSGKHLQRIEIAHHGVQFLFADCPVVLLGGLGRLQGTASRPCPLFDATWLWVPLAPYVGVSLNDQPAPGLQIAPVDAQALNLESWRYAKAYLATSLTADIDLALVRRPGTIKQERR